MDTPVTSSQSARFTDQLASLADPIMEAQHAHPFVRGIGDGTLPVERFAFWIRQDYLFLIEYCRLFARAASRSPDLATIARFADLLQASVGENLGFSYLEGARPLFPAEVNRLDPDFAAQVRWLDWLVQNPDRGPANPNILVQGRRFWLIDHGAALPFQHDWRAVTEASPLRPEPPLPHLLDGHALRLAAWDPLLTALLTREALTAAVDDVPASFLAPLLPEGIGADALRRRRAAYVAFLWKRLQGPRGFSVAAG